MRKLSHKKDFIRDFFKFFDKIVASYAENACVDVGLIQEFEEAQKALIDARREFKEQFTSCEQLGSEAV